MRWRSLRNLAATVLLGYLVLVCMFIPGAVLGAVVWLVSGDVFIGTMTAVTVTMFMPLAAMVGELWRT